jgi:N-acyl-D-amino-acid deacylase
LNIDLLIKGGTLIDGIRPRSPHVKADVAIKGDRIVKVGDLAGTHTDRTIDATGLFISPGFIDTHSHSEFTLLADNRAQGKVCQGVTTEINGNCGLSAAPLYGAALEQRERDLDEFNIRDRWNTFDEYYEIIRKKGLAMNFATLVGHGNLRASTAGYDDRPLTGQEWNRICELLDNSFASGVIGVSTGLIYPPGLYSDTGELINLACKAKERRGIYTTHMRSEGDSLLESIDEVLKIARGSGIHAHISHLKTSGEKNWSKLHHVLKKIDSARADGIGVTFDRYPYTASNTDLDTVLPTWAFEGGHKKEMERLKNERARLAEDILKDNSDSIYWDNIMISSVDSAKNNWMPGKSLLSISASLNKDPVACLFDILIEEELRVGAIFFSMNEDNLKVILQHPCSTIGSDSAARSFTGITSEGKPHPRGFGSFPRILGHYVREQGTMELSEAIHKMTGLAAKIFNLEGRGIIDENYYADITLFDPDKVTDRADYANPFLQPEGIHHVLVNGSPVLLDGEMTGSLPGRILGK